MHTINALIRVKYTLKCERIFYELVIKRIFKSIPRKSERFRHKLLRRFVYIYLTAMTAVIGVNEWWEISPNSFIRAGILL